MSGEPNNMASGEGCASLAIDCISGFGGVGNYWADAGCAPGDYEYHARPSVCKLPLAAPPLVRDPSANDALEANCKAQCRQQ